MHPAKHYDLQLPFSFQAILLERQQSEEADNYIQIGRLLWCSQNQIQVTVFKEI